jgi:hypothetical protein
MTWCRDCKYELLDCDLLPCAICRVLLAGKKNQWEPKEEEQ